MLWRGWGEDENLDTDFGLDFKRVGNFRESEQFYEEDLCKSAVSSCQYAEDWELENR